MRTYTPAARRFRPVLFATSSRIKFVQAQLALGIAGLELEQPLAHARPYNEPYGLPRRQFLEAGLRQVVDRAGTGRLVFIEDTTVRIEALSDEDDFPGQATKEWFAGANNRDVISALLAKGDTRVVVRSDIALHVPGLDEAVLFSGETHGEVVEPPPNLVVNELYPWLGRRDFSSWFRPDGASETLSELSYERSLSFDYRNHSLIALRQRLVEYRYIRSALTLDSPQVAGLGGQLSLLPTPGEDLLVIIVGPPASGKTTAGHHLKLYRGFRHVEGSIALRDSAAMFGVAVTLDAFEQADQLFSEQGADAVEREVVWPHFQSLGGPMVYTGARTVEGVEYLVSQARTSGTRVLIAHVSAGLSTRYARALARARQDVGPRARFEERSLRDEDYGAGRHGRRLADVLIPNSGDIGTFIRAIDRFATRALPAGWEHGTK